MNGDRQLAGFSTVGTFAPIQLFAGESDTVTTQGTYKAGNVFGKLNERNETYKFAVLALSGGKLVPWNPLGNAAAEGYATGTLTLANAVPVAGDKVTINGVDMVFRAAVAAVTDILIGATVNESAANAATAIEANRNGFNVDGGVLASAVGAVVTIKSPGVAGNAVTLAKTFATGANGTVSGATLAGGVDGNAEPGGAGLPIAIAPHHLDASAAGYNADVDGPMFIGGVFNFDALDLPAGTTYAEIRQLFFRTDITIQKLY